MDDITPAEQISLEDYRAYAPEERMVEAALFMEWHQQHKEAYGTKDRPCIAPVFVEPEATDKRTGGPLCFLRGYWCHRLSYAMRYGRNVTLRNVQSFAEMEPEWFRHAAQESVRRWMPLNLRQELCAVLLDTFKKDELWIRFPAHFIVEYAPHKAGLYNRGLMAASDKALASLVACWRGFGKEMDGGIVDEHYLDGYRLLKWMNGVHDKKPTVKDLPPRPADLAKAIKFARGEASIGDLPEWLVEQVTQYNSDLAKDALESTESTSPGTIVPGEKYKPNKTGRSKA